MVLEWKLNTHFITHGEQYQYILSEKHEVDMFDFTQNYIKLS